MDFLAFAKEHCEEFIKLRKQLHQNPELGFKEHKTSALVAAYLKDFGYSLHTDIASTAVVGVLKKGSGFKSIAFRADMDALPMQEASGCEYASLESGKMHACGHDGHTASLLLAAKLFSLMEFDGQVILIFQPSEEASGADGLTGAMKMVESGIFKKLKADFVFAYHNVPSLQLNDDKSIVFAKSAAIMAGVARFSLEFQGKGGHASAPHLCADPIAAAASFINALYAFKSNYLSSKSGAVLNVTAINADAGAFNIIPQSAKLEINMRALDNEQMSFMQERLASIAAGIASGFGLGHSLIAHESLLATINDDKAQEFLVSCARELFGSEYVNTTHEALNASEDFGYLAREIGCGCYCFFNNGNSANLHSASYVFNDNLIYQSAALWAFMLARYLQ